MATETFPHPHLPKEILDMVNNDMSDEGLSDASETIKNDYTDRKVSVFVEDSLYALPVDEIEWDRQYKQHVMLLLALPGLYATPEAVRRALAPEDGVQKAILDVGTGTGTWAMAMANEFPHVEVVGIDLTPNMSLPTPPNCRFEFDDVNYGLPHYHGCFDVVHARSCTNGIKDYSAFIDEISLCLRPGGVILLAEGDFNLCGPTKVPLESASHGDEEGKSWFRRLLFEVYELMEARKTSLAGGAIVANGLGDHPAFEQAGTKDLHICIGPWEKGKTPEETRHLNIIGTLMRQNSLEFARAWKPLLLSAEYPLDTVNDWIERIDAELMACNPPMYCRFQYAWAVKRPVPGTAATAPAAQPTAQTTAASTSASSAEESNYIYDLPIWDAESVAGDSRPASLANVAESRWKVEGEPYGDDGEASSSLPISHQPQQASGSGSSSSPSSSGSRSSTPPAEGAAAAGGSGGGEGSGGEGPGDAEPVVDSWTTDELGEGFVLPSYGTESSGLVLPSYGTESPGLVLPSYGTESSGFVLPSYGTEAEASGSRSSPAPACADVADHSPSPSTSHSHTASSPTLVGSPPPPPTPRRTTGKRSAAEFDEDEVNHLLTCTSPSPSVCSSTRSTRSATRRKL